MSSTCLRIRFSKALRRSSPTAWSASVPAPSASRLPDFVDDRDALRLQPVDGGGDEMADGADLLLLQRAAHPHHDRGRRLRRLAREQRPLGQHEVDARGLDAVDAADGAGELAFQRAQMIDVLDEARGAERVRLVEDLVADAAALGQAAFGELHAQPRHLVLRHQDDAALVAHLVRECPGVPGP